VSSEGDRRISRRKLLAGGAGGVVLVAGVNYGRFALGDEFEEHVAGVLGTSTAVATQLTAAARERLGGFEYDQVATRFLAVTTFPGSELAPGSIRDKAIRRLLTAMIAESTENLMYVGARAPTDSLACSGLLRS